MLRLRLLCSLFCRTQGLGGEIPSLFLPSSPQRRLLTPPSLCSAANLPPTPGPLDRHFLRAAALIHADFSQLPTASEVIIR